MLSTLTYPRPEYPRPERQRGTLEGVDWLNLNGPWQFRFDRFRKGLEEGWHQPSEQDWREQIIVPFCWESLAAWGEGEAAGNENYYATRVYLNPLEVTKENHRSMPRYEVGWYRRQVCIPNTPTWENKRIILTIGAADFFTDGWCNGKNLGHNEGGYTPFEFDLTDALETQPDGTRAGLLVLRVEDPMNNTEQPVGKQWRWYTTTSGIWQTVFIEPRNQAHIDCFRVQTDIDHGTSRFEVDCLSAPDGATLTADILSPSGEPQQAVFKIKNQKGAETVLIHQLFLWDPNQPHLYQLTLKLEYHGEVLDQIKSYFGMRKIDFAPVDGRESAVALRLNNVARYLRGALNQSYYPDGVYTAGDVETLKNDILWAKKFGFNFLRIHIKIDDPLLLYYADSMGMMLMADFPNFGEGGDTPLGRKRFEAMMCEGIKRDFNHPSIVAWCIFNETWGFGGQTEFVDVIYPVNPKHRKQGEGGLGISAGISATAVGVEKRDKAKLANTSSHAWVQNMWELAKHLDPTRLIEDMSVCHWEHLDYFQHGNTDINSWHFYMSDYQRAKEHIEKIVNSTFLGSSFNYVPGFQHKGQPLINSEYGGVGALDGDVDVSWSFKFLTNELRRHPQISAYIYTELADVEWEHNGFLNYDRTPKEFGYDPAVINESNTLPVDAPPISRVGLGAKLSVHVDSSHYSSKPIKDVHLQWRLGGVDTSGQLHQKLAFGSVPIMFIHRMVAYAHNIELTMPTSAMLCTLTIEACSADGRVVASNFVHFFVGDGYPPNVEKVPRGLILRGAPADWQKAEWSIEMGNREKERAEDVCYGLGFGYFEWALPLGNADLSKARRVRVLCEASSRRIDAPQTDEDIWPTTFLMTLNGVRIYQAILRNHPHDARGALSYLRGGKGAYGYLAHALVEYELLQQIASEVKDGHLYLRCAVPKDALPQGGLTIYGSECGRYPVCPTVIIEW
ncbi:MAG: glycoside hydrolase family 2 sugar binding [Verrucomicrobiales bacterium]|nr:glycoside hydrolase family 2 sugar binding [Verrucomicrobiales bacterium]